MAADEAAAAEKAGNVVEAVAKAATGVLTGSYAERQAAAGDKCGVQVRPMGGCWWVGRWR